MLNPGTYNAIAKSAQLSEAKTGTEQVAVLFEIVDAEFAGQTITWFGFLTENAMRRTLESLRHAGWTGDDITELSSLSGDTPNVQLVVEHEEWNGQTRAKVKWVNSGNGGLNTTPLAANKAEALKRKVKAAALAMAREQGGAKAAAPAPARRPQPSRTPPPASSGAPESDDIPF